MKLEGVRFAAASNVDTARLGTKLSKYYQAEQRICKLFSKSLSIARLTGITQFMKLRLAGFDWKPIMWLYIYV